MRYTELIEARRPRRPLRPLILPRPFRGDVKLVIRFMPAVYRWLDLEIVQGDPRADIALDCASIGFREPYAADGTLTRACREWIISNVRDEVEKRGLSISVVFGPEDCICVSRTGDLVVANRPPEGGLLI